MIDPNDTGNTDASFSDDPPNTVVLRARAEAKALSRSIYVYRRRSGWVVTKNASEPPVDVAVWMIPANQNNPGRNWGGC